MIKVSVVIPVYNKAPFLKECFDSVFAQTFRDFEVIAVDDRSTDESLSLLNGMNDPRLRVIALDKNLGPAGCAQRGFDAAKGEYIVRMDADDVMFPDRIERQVAFMDAHPEVGASGSHMELLYEPGVMRRATLSDTDCRAVVLFHIPIYQPSSIYRREVLERHSVRFQDDWPQYGEDWLFQLRLLKVTRLANMDEALVRYRVGSQNISYGRDNHADLITLFSAVLDWHGLPADREALRQHLHAIKFFPAALRPSDVVAVKRYLAGLRAQVRHLGLFDPDAFDRRLERVWDDLAYQMPRFGWATSWSYFRHDRRPSFAKLRYMLSSLLRGRIYTGGRPHSPVP